MVYIGADHRGFYLKEKVKEWLTAWEYEWRDLGAESYDQNDDYPDIAFKVGGKVVADNGKGVLICGSGVGVCVAANKMKGIRAGVCLTERQVFSGRNDDDMNILCLNADIVAEEENQAILKAFLETPFGSEERYVRRINKIKEYETKEC